MVTSSRDPPQKSFQIKEDDRFFSRLLSKESCTANSSFRVLYYGRTPGAIPFLWESRPGTPKHTFSDNSLPPLTPPPSYHFNSNTKSMQRPSRSSKLLCTIFPRLAPKKTHVSPFSSKSSMSSPSCSSSYSSPSTLMNPKFRGDCLFLRPRSPLHYGVDGDEQAIDSPTSTSCFGVRHETSDGIRGCFQWRK